MNAKTWLKIAKTQISPLDAELILCRVLHFEDRSALAVHDRTPLSPRQVSQANRYLRARACGRPLAYIFGYKDFYGRRFTVNRHVLIPRPESEALIDLAKELKPKKVLDLGTGSGCLGLTLALELGPTTKVTCADISRSALAVATDNFHRLVENGEAAASVDFLVSDLLAQIPDPTSYDLIIANLPYVDKTWNWLDTRSLRYEPDRALYCEDGGLALYKKLFAEAKEYHITAPLLIEADLSQHHALQLVAPSFGYQVKKIDGYAVLLD